MSDTVPIEKIKIEGYFETTTPFKIKGDQFVDENDQPIDIDNIFKFTIYNDIVDEINKLEQDKLYEVVRREVKGGGKSKKKRGGNKRKTKSNRNKR